MALVASADAAQAQPLAAKQWVLLFAAAAVADSHSVASALATAAMTTFTAANFASAVLVLPV